jgi:hypothetical protein
VATVSDDQRPDSANPDESGRSDAALFLLADRPGGMSSRLLALSLVVLAVTGLAAAGLAAGGAGQDGTSGHGPGPTATGPAATSSDGPDGNESGGPPPGARLAGAVAVSATEVGSGVGAGTFAAALADATSDDERARVVRERLDRTAGQLDDLARRTQELERARANGSLSPDRYRARGAGLAARIRGVLDVLDRAATATPTLSGEEGDRLGRRVETLRTRARSLLAGELRAAARTIDGTDVEGAASPVDLDEVVAAYERSGGRAPGFWVALFGSERIALHVQRANGRTAVFGLHTSGGAVVDSTRGSPADPTLRVETDYRVVRGVATGEDPWSVASRALAEDRITYRGVGALATLKYGLIAVVLFLFDGLRTLLFGALDLLAGLVEVLAGSGHAR